MKVTLFKAFPDPYRKSMVVYADQLLRNLCAVQLPTEKITSYLPRRIRLAPRMARSWSQYIGYQLKACFTQGDINHIVDDSFGHLAYSLDARKTVVTFHDATVFKAANGTIKGEGISKGTLLSLRYSSAAVRNVAAVIAVSEISRQDFLQFTDCDPKKVHVVHHGIDSSFRVLQDRDVLKVRYGLKGQHMLHVGHNLFYMNIEGVLRVLHHLVFRLGLDVKLLKVGLPFTAVQNELVHGLKLEERIVFLGDVSTEDLPIIYNCADVLLYPVLNSGFGFPPLEAMACGTPVVCSNRGSLPEIVGDAALMAGPYDHEKLAIHVASLLENKLVYATYREKGLEHVRRYSWEKTAREVLAIYRNIHETNRRR